MAQYNFILVVGDEELQSKTINVRTRDGKVQRACFAVACSLMLNLQIHGTKSVDAFVGELTDLVKRKQ